MSSLQALSRFALFLLPSAFLRHCFRETGSVMRSEALSLHFGCDSSSHRQACATTRSTLVPVPRGTPRVSNDTVGERDRKTGPIEIRENKHTVRSALCSANERKPHTSRANAISGPRDVSKARSSERSGYNSNNKAKHLVTCTFEPW